ncbi:MAG: penicillin-binding protein 2 [Candidatus Nanopelagicales bacterium]|nr:penicillin-binding protein 2 [Candidatus Nanopelagicales bacterium]MCF8538840.1 penicillin-binding protein 2 [Candidatus Nanopelagicales bacterium]MCF8550461.1 penicillin-binding protein 2 [Candidatus Nanopelagicales bacterium]
MAKRVARQPSRGLLDTPIKLGNQSKRGLVLILVTSLMFVVFAARLVDLQGIRGSELASAALDQRLRTLEIPAQRGAILDSNGTALAITVEARNVTADQTMIEDPAVVAQALSPILGADADILAHRLTGERRFTYVAKEISPEKWESISQLRLPGIFSETTSRRIYPAGDLAANVIGFVGGEGTGLGGYEYAFDKELGGTPGELTYEGGPGGRAIPTAANVRVNAEQGVDIQLTIDSDIQFVAQQAIAEAVASAGAADGTVVVMDPQSGHILALATAPTFDANDPTMSDAADLNNRPLTNAFEPGSTSKVMTLAAVINEGAATPYTPIKVPGVLKRGDKDFKDHSPHGTLNLTLSGVMAKSSNIGTILAAERIGGKKLSKYLKKFGIGQETGLNFPGENKGFVPAYEDWSPTSFPTIAFGQGLSVNAVQAASVFATIANDGLRVEPSLVSRIIHSDGTVQEPEAPATTRVVSRETAKQVRSMLETVVGEGGTATNAHIPGYRIGGKTGTAQVVNNVTGGYGKDVIASFIGMAPADNPQLVVAVFISKPKAGRYGGEIAAPVFKKVTSYALGALEIPPTGAKAPKLALTFGG